MSLERRASVDPLAQWDLRGCQELLDVLEPRVLRGHQDPLAGEERRGSLVALGTLQRRDRPLLEPKERREMWGPLGSEEVPEPKGSRACPAWLFLETLAPRGILEPGVPWASPAEQGPRATQGLLERRETLGGLVLQDPSASEDEMAKLERKVTRAPRVTLACLEKLASEAFGGRREPEGPWARRETPEIRERTVAMALPDPPDPRVTVESRDPQDPLDGWWSRDLELERRGSLETVARRALEDPRVTQAPLEPPGKGGTQVSEAQPERRATVAPPAWTAAAHWMESREPLAPPGCRAPQAKPGTQGEMGSQASEENTAPPAPPEPRESQARTAGLAQVAKMENLGTLEKTGGRERREIQVPRAEKVATAPRVSVELTVALDPRACRAPWGRSALLARVFLVSLEAQAPRVTVGRLDPEGNRASLESAA